MQCFELSAFNSAGTSRYRENRDDTEFTCGYSQTVSSKNVAVVSSNRDAVNNIYDKIIEATSEERYDPVFAELYDHFAVLGKLELRKKWLEIMKKV